MNYAAASETSKGKIAIVLALQCIKLLSTWDPLATLKSASQILEFLQKDRIQ